MKISLVSIGTRTGRGKREGEELLVQDYLKRANRFAPSDSSWVESDSAFWGKVAGSHGRTLTKVILMDGVGRSLTSREFAAYLGDLRDRGTQQVIIGIGGADGWGDESRGRSDLVVSLGSMTLPHALARVVTAEQIYRALTILAGHPYHWGH